MVEIAISLAIIGIALVGIIGVLPLGLHTQRDNREQTIINQDATVLLQAVSSGARGMDDLTNYIYAITNYWTKYDSNGVVLAGGGSINDGYNFSGSQITKVASPPFFPITNGARIIGLLSTPEYTSDASGNFAPLGSTVNAGDYYSNHVVAYVRSISGPAEEKPPQNNEIIQQNSFTYRVLCVNAPVALDTNTVGQGYAKQLAANLRELRLLFLWPQQANGSVGNQRQNSRMLVAGQLFNIPDTTVVPNVPLYFYQPQSFTNAP
jgi:type II secretory pathway pseudopilin PulG